MNIRNVFGVAALGLLLSAPAGLMAQQPRTRPTMPQPRIGTTGGTIGGPTSGTTAGPMGRTTGRLPRGVNAQGNSCMQQAGIPRSVIMKRRATQESIRAQEAAVCANPALSEQQKMERIREIRMSANQQFMGLLTPAQREALQQCQSMHQHLGGARHGMPFPGGGHAAGPCSGLHGIMSLPRLWP